MATARRLRKNKSAFHTDEHDVLNGRAKIFRTDASGDFWQLRMWVAAEAKYVRKTLKTKDLDTAVIRAEEEVLKIMSDVSNGRKIFGINLKELTDKYVDWRQEDVELGNITAGRLVTIKSQIKHLLAYKGDNLKLSELDEKSLHDYANYRKKTSSGVRDITIANEQSTINHMMAFAHREKLISHFQKFYFRKLDIDQKEEVKRRGVFTLEEYDALVRFMRTYVSEKHCADVNERNERQLVRDCILIAANTMLRVGELWNLVWGDIESIRHTYGDDERAIALVTINVRAEIAKTNRSRKVVSRGGEYFERLRERSGQSSKSDYIFTAIGKKTKISKQKWYSHWANLMNGIDIDYKKRNITWYSLRHFGITCRLRAEVYHFEISRIAGTSVANIENHYGHIDMRMLERAALKTFALRKDGLETFGD